MKKSVFLILTIIGLGLQANAQEIAKNAIGIRLSESDGFGPEVNYQRALGDSNRLELGLAFHSKRNWDAVKLTGIYQWVWNIDGGFNWYAGPGVGAGIVNYDRKYKDYPNDDRYKDSEAFAFLTGDVGIEYSFDFPLLISFDFRPQANLNYRDDVTFDVGLSARYQF
ncbi:hypothetical protein Aeqsu_2739 [Aequorivita sublithincola DSM 14238]|uniref:Outer membrane protein beta-barrel domain-containing protein n=1 Tax=Aequorivita sublithincola (strain DSM 14238 / LMG 21431 / ACAM 643 / 9-3) TaxID=746697 RepID=I3YYX2_AEQSU|nr:hypothetical protein [Aequorivita sublithincola]AFL82190.1 hypothetical protein Aeqsu_2739 [Aequorivita sublithincola DSM 14238]